MNSILPGSISPIGFEMFYINFMCREVVMELIEEYRAAERPDYVNWGIGDTHGAGVPASLSSLNLGETSKATDKFDGY